ncbi:MAG: hypothetical protein PVS3B3_05790 [Ktedonobacteraceae bacterium]
MKFGICASYHDVATLQARAFDYLEENVQRFLVPEQPQQHFEGIVHEARSLALPIETCNSMLPTDMSLIATPQQQVDTIRLEHYIKTMLHRAEQVGIRVIVFGSGQARACPPGYSSDDAVKQLGVHLATWSEWGREHGVFIALEPLRYEETNVLNTVTEGGALVTKQIHSGATLLIDTYHMACNGEMPIDILPWTSLIAHVHVAEKQDRAAPGHYGEDLRPYFSALHAGGYDQRISIECRWQDFAHEVGPAIETVKQQWMDIVGTDDRV